MIEINDEQIQQWLEAGEKKPLEDHSAKISKELGIYPQLFEALEQAPVINLSSDFSARVSLQIQKRRERKRNISFVVLLTLLSLIGIGGAIFVIGIDSIVVVANLILEYKWFVIAGLAGFWGLQYLDQRLTLRQGGWV